MLRLRHGDILEEDLRGDKKTFFSFNAVNSIKLHMGFSFS